MPTDYSNSRFDPPFAEKQQLRARTIGRNLHPLSCVDYAGTSQPPAIARWSGAGRAPCKVDVIQHEMSLTLPVRRSRTSTVSIAGWARGTDGRRYLPDPHPTGAATSGMTRARYVLHSPQEVQRASCADGRTRTGVLSLRRSCSVLEHDLPHRRRASHSLGLLGAAQPGRQAGRLHVSRCMRGARNSRAVAATPPSSPRARRARTACAAAAGPQPIAPSTGRPQALPTAATRARAPCSLRQLLRVR